MFPSTDAPIVARGTLRLDWTTHTSRCPVTTDLLSSFLSGKSVDQPFSSRALVLIVVRDIAELTAVELAFAPFTRGVRFGHIRDDVCFFTSQQLFTSVISLVRN